MDEPVNTILRGDCIEQMRVLRAGCVDLAFADPPFNIGYDYDVYDGCQMPEQLLGRIIRTCSKADDLVFDPFSGSATTLAVARKLGRRYLGCELSEEYVNQGLARLGSIRVGDALNGSPEPTASAPKTSEGRRLGEANGSSRKNRLQRDRRQRELW